MFGLIKELIDRFIEFVLRNCRGDTREEQLSHAIYISAFILVLSVWGNIYFLVRVQTLNADIERYEIAPIEVGTLFDKNPETNPLSMFIKINDQMTERLQSLSGENIFLVKSNAALTEGNNLTKQRNDELKEEVSHLRSVNTILSRKATLSESNKQ